jgi:hypothetical protein
MNITYPPISLADLPPVYNQLGHELVKATAFLLIPTELLYFSIYFHVKGLYRTYEFLTFLSIGAFWLSPWFAPISCGPARCLQNFTSMPHTKNLYTNGLTDNI